MPPPPPRLPRSLIPLPGEDLPGYTLRLAHRLDLTPIELLRQTGLVASDRHTAPARLMLTMEGGELTGFCAATTMSVQDALGLTLRPYVTSYPPVAERCWASVASGSGPGAFFLPGC